MLKPALQLRVGQSLAMTPQLQQAIRLLQLSSLELQIEIQQNFETNPMLEKAEDGQDFDSDKQKSDESTNPDSDAGDNSASDTSAETEVRTDQEQMGEDLPVDSNWDDIYPTANTYNETPSEPARDVYENETSGTGSIQEHLQSQLDLLTLSDNDRIIGLTIIDEIGADGYLLTSVEDLHTSLVESLEVELDEVVAVLKLIQQLEPIGCGSRDLAECLRIQLHQLPTDTPLLDKALMVADKHLNNLAGHNTRQIMRNLGLSEDQLQEVITLIQSLNPRPGAQITSSQSEYVIPDVTVSKKEGAWRVELNSDVAPKLRINSMYANLIKRADNSNDNNYLRGQLQEARWFIKSLQSRNETLLRVATAIVGYQRRFLEYGEEAMQPLVLRDIAEQLEMHESTISRVTTNKYMHTPRGIYEFKYFFSSHVGTADGGACSATAIRAILKKLIEQEPPAKPLSDSKIANLLSEKGINVARRTVAKYREAMSIPPSNERKRL